MIEAGTLSDLEECLAAEFNDLFAGRTFVNSIGHRVPLNSSFTPSRLSRVMMRSQRTQTSRSLTSYRKSQEEREPPRMTPMS